MTLKTFEGNKVPLVNFKIRENDDWKTLTTQELFENKTVVAFSLPGAFTPTCSSTHLPRYNELAQAFFQNGVDEIICLSVNDAFVMNEWAKIKNLRTLAYYLTATANSPNNSACLSIKASSDSASAHGDTPCLLKMA